MPKMDGMEMLARIVETAPGTNVILLTGHYSVESAVQAIQRGACDYLTKPVSPALLRQRMSVLVEEAKQQYSALQLDAENLRAHQFEGIVGRSPVLLQALGRIRRIAPHFRTALITGPTGSGKELVATALHRSSPVSIKRFAVCNCSAVVETLFESELFGHVKGAFTGAIQDKTGLFEYANDGTVFLDEIGDMPLDAQGKLLRILENGEVQRVGSPVIRKVDVRVIAATNRDLRDMVAQKQFREDLFYRLSMVEISLPSLAQRKEDLPLLECCFIEQFARQYNKVIRGLTQSAQIVLARYSWPGNIRELKSVLGSACMMAQGDMIDVRDLPEFLRSPTAAQEAEDETMLSLAEVERRQVLRVLEHVGGNKARAAKVLGINRATIYRILDEDAPDAQIASE
jgi:DNA-binding NtrC family response regulator